MRVLVANKFWYSRGGLERVMFDEIALLEAAGHEVAHFSTAHPRNQASPWSEYFVEYLGLGPGESSGVSGRLSAATRMFYSRSARDCFARLCDRFQPDIVHVHGIHRQLSPSILREAQRRGVPVVQTLHDYHHVCPADTLLLRGSSVCQPARCSPLNCFPAIENACLRGSRAASALSACETVFQRITGAYSDTVALFLCPSRFMADVMTAGGWDSSRLRLLPNSCSVTSPPVAMGGRMLIASRMVPEKGIEVALMGAERAAVSVDVAGEGPERERLESRFRTARFLGMLDAPAMMALTGQARAMVVPSLVLENAPMSVLEAMAAGVPVIASRIGGISEQVRDGIDGFLCEPGDVEAFGDAMRRLADDVSLARQMGMAAQERVARAFSPQAHVDALTALYREAVQTT